MSFPFISGLRSNDLAIAELKRKKLKLKDEIARIESLVRG